jgi:Cu2+-exporting ATPase/Cu+-exporting ATPase
MTCVNCARSIEIALRRKEGVREVKVSFELGKVEVSFDNSKITEEEIHKTIEELGYRVVREEEDKRELYTLVAILLMSAPLMPLMFINSPWSLHLQFLLATLVQVIGGYSFYRGAYSSLKNGVANMDVLVALGTTGAYTFSLLAYMGFIEAHPFFETSAYLISFVKLGKFLEDYARKKALSYLKNMFTAQYRTVKLVSLQGEIEVPVREVFRNSIVLFKTGDTVLFDGVIVDGKAYLDESILTGEPEPQAKGKGDKVISGSVVIEGLIKVKVESTFTDSFISRISTMVEEALSSKPKIQRLADKVSHYFVQVVIVIALITFGIWFYKDADLQQALTFSLSVLVISCPCALGIATPLAIAVGIVRSLREGILIKKPEVLEKVGSIDLLLFDKTGTLTEGKFKVINYQSFVPEALDYAYSIEKISNHPIAKAITEFCRLKGAREIELHECREKIGVGINCRELIARDGSFWGIKANGTAKVIGVGTENQPYALFYLEDTLREEARRVVEEIRKLGIKTVLITGDSKEKAEYIAKELGFEEVYWQVKPSQKLEMVKELQRKGFKVAMVGDGVNDAPAMAKADVSFAVGSGTDITKQVGDIVLLSGIKALPSAILWGRATYRKIKENLFWAFIYNAIGIPLAAGVFYGWGLYLKPEVAGLLMALSSLSVVLNTLRLRFRRQPR